MWGYTALPDGLLGQSAHPMFWKVACAILALMLVLREYSRTGMPSFVQHQLRPTVSASETTTRLPFPPTSNANSIDVSPWEYAWPRDSNNQGLSAEQCDLAFPELYDEIDRAKQHFSVKNITEKDISLFHRNEGGVRVLIADSQVRIVETRGLHRGDFRHRIIAIVQQIVQAVATADASGEPIPTIEFTIVVDDMAVLNNDSPGALWAFTRRHADVQQENVWVIPDFHFFGAPPEAEGFRTMQAKSRRHDSPLEKKIPQVVWRGATGTNRGVRQPLLEATTGKSWANVTSIDWHHRDTSFMAMDDFCKYRYTVNTEGRSWSARMTHLFNCDSLLFVHDIEWIAHYYHLLDVGTNCVHVNRTFLDLEEQINYFDKNLDQAQRIADQARQTFRERYTTPAATACYWRKLMRTWAAAVSFTPRLDMAKDGSRMKKTRGITFEEFIVHRNDQDYPYKKRR